MVRPLDSSGYAQHTPRVHFSPVVSQLRYSEQQSVPPRPIKSKPNSNYCVKEESHPHQQQQQQHNHYYYNYSQEKSESKSERVTVQVQEVIVPPLPPKQKVLQVTVPSLLHHHQNGSGPSDNSRYAFEVNVPRRTTCSSTSPTTTNTTSTTAPAHPSSSSSSSTTMMMDVPHEKINTVESDEGGYGKNNKQSACCAYGSSSSTSGGGSSNAAFNPIPQHGGHLTLNGSCKNIIISGTSSQPSTTITPGNELSNGHYCNQGVNKNDSHKSAYGYEYYGYSYGLPDHSKWEKQYPPPPWIPPSQMVPHSNTRCSSRSNQVFDEDHDHYYYPNPNCSLLPSKNGHVVSNSFRHSKITTATMPVVTFQSSRDPPLRQAAQQLLLGQTQNNNRSYQQGTQILAPRECSNDISEENLLNCTKEVTSPGLKSKTKDGSNKKSKKQWSRYMSGISRRPEREENNSPIKKVNKIGVKPKLSFLQRITLGRLGNQSKSKGSSNKSGAGNNSNIPTNHQNYQAQFGGHHHHQVVPVSSWPVKSLTKVVIVDSSESVTESPINNSSCSSCGDLGKKRNGKKGKDHSSAGTTSTTTINCGSRAGAEDKTRIPHNPAELKARTQSNDLNVNIPYHHCPFVRTTTTAAEDEGTLCICVEEKKCYCRERFPRSRSRSRTSSSNSSRSSSGGVALRSKGNLGSRSSNSNIPFTDTWDPQTADQTHFVKVENERKASAATPISHLGIPSSTADYGDEWGLREIISGSGSSSSSSRRQREQKRAQEYIDRKNGGANKSIGIHSASLSNPNLPNKNVATSPIHHLSAFYALNLPIVPPKYTSSSELTGGEPIQSPPVPKPRVKKLRRKNSLPEESTSSNNTVSETDELSANVDRILDEIAGLELECLKMETAKENFLQSDYLHDGDNKENEQRFAKSQSSPNYETGREPWMAGLLPKTPQPHSSHKVWPVGKPPLPPSAKSITATRQDFFSSNNSNNNNVDSRAFGKPGMSGTDLDVKLLKFRVQLYRSREELAKSHPNLEEIEDTVRSSMVIDRSSRQRTLPLSLCRGNEKPENSPASTTTHVSGQILHRHTPDPVTIEKERSRAQEWSKLCRKVNQNFLRSPPSNNNRHGNIPAGPSYFTGIVETDLDTGASREIIGGDEQLHFESSFGQEQQQQQEYEQKEWNNVSNSRDGIKSKNLPLSIFPDDGRLSYSLNQKTQSMLNLGSPTSTMSHSQKSATIASTASAKGTESGMLSVASTSSDERARSMEFLLEDSDKNAHLRPPENNLMHRQENRQLSEHELRIQRSLNKLNVPDWYKKYSSGGDGGGGGGASSAGGSASGSKAKLFGSGTGLAGGWSGLSASKTSSLTSLQSTGRTHFSRLRSTGTASSGARSSRESLMSPSSTASASPSPYYERSSFTYGMPYALTRFASARMSCGASPASLSPSPSPVGGIGGSSTSTPVSSAPLSRHHSYSKAPYLGWRSQERLTSKTMYRSPSERLAADFLAQKSKASASSSTASTPKETERETPEIHLQVSPKKETVSASDLSLNNSEESNSHKLNRVRSSIKEVSNAIVDYVNESKPLDDGINGGSSPRKGFVWLESSFVGTKPIDSPGTPDTPAMFMTASRQLPAHDAGSSSSITRPRHVFRFDDEHPSSFREPGFTSKTAPQAPAASSRTITTTTTDSALATANSNGSATTYTPYHSRNEQMEERSNSSSVSSPTLEDILDSLLALRRPNKKIRARSGKGHSREPAPPPPPHLDPSPVSDWQERMNQPVLDTAYFPISNDDFFPPTAVTSSTVTTSNITSTSANNFHSDSYNISSISSYHENVSEDNVGGGGSGGGGVRSGSCISGGGVDDDDDDEEEVEEEEEGDDDDHGHCTNIEKTYNCTTSVMYTGNNGDQMESITVTRGSMTRRAVPEPVVVELGHNDTVAPRMTTAGEDVVDMEEDTFGAPTDICTGAATVSSSSAVNAMASLNDSNPPTPARHRRVSFDLDISDKEEKSSSRSNRRDESVGGTIHCRNSKCAKSASGLEARREFKTCHNCNAYYCSRECRRAHWDKHKKVCMQSRVGALCKQIINHVKEDSFVVSQLSAVARRGFLGKGRGTVKLFFSSPDRAERFLTGGLPELPEPWYIPCGDILPEEMGAQTFSELSEQCRTYNGDNRFVLYVSVCVVNEVPTSGAVKWEREMISRSSKLRLLLPRNYEETMHHQSASTAHLFPEEPHVPAYQHEADSTPGAQENPLPPPPPTPPSNGSENETLILRSVPPPTSHQLSRSDHKRLREVSFANIQKHLLERGVELRRTYPDVYSKLCNYVEHDEPFLPVTIYPRNSNTGGQFVCVIMPECSDSALEDYTSRSNQVETVNISENAYDLC